VTASDGTAPGPALVPVEGLHHYTICVADIDESVRWYGSAFGFTLVGRNGDHPLGTAAYMEGHDLRLEMFEVPDARPVPGYAAGPEPDTDLSVCGHKHMALLLPGSLGQAGAALEALGVPVVDTKIVSLEGIGEFRALFITDNNGALVELPEDGRPGRTSHIREAGVGGPLAVQGLHHVALCVHDRDEAMKWYSKTLGFTVATTFEVPAIGLKTAMMQCPGFWVELHSLAGALPVPPERRQPLTDLLTLGNKYFALTVTDLDGAVERLVRAGVDPLLDFESGGARHVFVSDISGSPIELCE